VIIGVAAYENLDSSGQLRFAETDAEAMYAALISKEGGAFPAENVVLLKGKDATLSAIREKLESWLPSVATPEDRVVVYFAGHGLIKNGAGYLAPFDVNLGHIETTAYPMRALADTMATRVKARWKVLLTDACHSGKINPETTNESVDAQLKSLSPAFLTLTATSEFEKSYEDPELSTGFGLFTYFVVQALKGNADNDPPDGKITADELIEYVRSNVRRYAKDRGASQTPSDRGLFDPNMILGVNTTNLKTGSTAPSMVGTAIVEANTDNVEVFIDGKLVGKISANKPLIQPGLSSGLHTFEGVKQGYEPDRKEVMIAPGQSATVTLRIRYPRAIKKSALDAGTQGEKLLLTQRSKWNPLNMSPVQRVQSEGDLRRAREKFLQALKEDPSYSTAAFRLGQVNQLLSDGKGSLEAYKRAIDIDPGYIDARLQYAAVLIESGDADEAIRQMTEAAKMEPANNEAYSLMARAYWEKGIWSLCIEQADKAIELSSDQAHLWRADALRQLAAVEKDNERRTQLYRQARDSYKDFLRLTNFSTPAYEWALFHFVGFGLGSSRHADRKASYDQLRSSGFLGMCLCEQKLGNPQRAREYCERGLKYDPKDPIARFLVGNIYRDLYNRTDRCEYLVSARDNYAVMIKLNPDLVEAKNARDYVDQIGAILPSLRRKGLCP